MKRILFIFYYLVSFNVSGQIEDFIIHKYISESDWEIKTTDSLGCYVPTNGDTTKIRFYSNPRGTFKYYENGILLVEGDLLGGQGIDSFWKNGKWIEYFLNGNKKSEAYFYRDRPIGDYFEFYENGQLKRKLTYASVRMKNNLEYNGLAGGTYEYYENGKLKTSGQYSCIEDSIEFEYFDPEKEEIFMRKKIGLVEKEIGIWYYYDNVGNLLKTVEKIELS